MAGAGKPTSTCAVVGNGGGLLGMEAGSEIDKHDVVIRFNGGPVRGFERFVGRKTTFRHRLHHIRTCMRLYSLVCVCVDTAKGA